MKPNDIYALPALETVSWQDSHETLIRKAFDFELYGDLDREAAREAGDARLTVDLKLTCRVDAYERSSSIYALSLDGKPFGVYAASGRGEYDYANLLITDESLYLDAVAHISRWRYRPNVAEVVDPDEPSDGIAAFYGTAIARTAGGPRLAIREHIASDGTLLFDADVFRSEIADVRRRFANSPPGGFPLQHHGVREAVAESIAKAIPSDLASVLVNELDRDETEAYRTWTALAVATDEGTYEIGLQPWHLQSSDFSWTDSVRVQRVGGPELMDDYAGASAPRP